jgi:hypothetical protein
MDSHGEVGELGTDFAGFALAVGCEQASIETTLLRRPRTGLPASGLHPRRTGRRFA